MLHACRNVLFVPVSHRGWLWWREWYYQKSQNNTLASYRDVRHIAYRLLGICSESRANKNPYTWGTQVRQFAYPVWKARPTLPIPRRPGPCANIRFDPREGDALCSPFARYLCSMSKPSQSQLPKSFEAALAELDKIVASMEAGQLPLEQSIAAYKRGAQLLQFCQNALKDATQQVKLLDAGMLKDLSVDGEPTVANDPE